nr:putative armadillo-type fold protein [Tanacetum cinerariifolium]
MGEVVGVVEKAGEIVGEWLWVWREMGLVNRNSAGLKRGREKVKVFWAFSCFDPTRLRNYIFKVDEGPATSCISGCVDGYSSSTWPTLIYSASQLEKVFEDTVNNLKKTNLEVSWRNLFSEQTFSQMRNLLRRLRQILPPEALESKFSSLQPERQLVHAGEQLRF